LSLGPLLFYFFEFQNVTDFYEMHVQFKSIRCISLRTLTVSLAAKQTQLIFTQFHNTVFGWIPKQIIRTLCLVQIN